MLKLSRTLRKYNLKGIDMNWLYFFMGTTFAWVFMGLVLFGADITRTIFFPTKKQKSFNNQLIEFWNRSVDIQKENLIIQENIKDCLRDISLNIPTKNKGLG